VGRGCGGGSHAGYGDSVMVADGAGAQLRCWCCRGGGRAFERIRREGGGIVCEWAFGHMFRAGVLGDGEVGE